MGSGISGSGWEWSVELRMNSSVVNVSFTCADGTIVGVAAMVMNPVPRVSAVATAAPERAAATGEGNGESRRNGDEC